jgi:hypothetical protein
MKPEASSPNFNLDQPLVKHGVKTEFTPNTINPELNMQNGAERYEQNAEMSAVASDIGFTSVLPTPIIIDDNIATTMTISDSPTIANDDDLIEKEWVDKAKKIVAETKDDPYRREEAVSKMQVDYLKKRFGRELGTNE